MIICPNCKEEIDEQSPYCDQCGHKLLYCEHCGRVGIGRRCTSCGALMVAPHSASQQPQLTLYNDMLGIRIIGATGAIIGRRQGPYAQQLAQQGYVSGTHAQLNYSSATGWSIADRHSSTGTRLNDHQLQPDVEMSLKNGDILTLANVVLNVSIN